MSGSFVQQLIQQVFPILQSVDSSLTVSVSYNSISATDYDPVAGVAGTTVTPYTFSGVLSKFTSKEVDAKVVVETDAKLICSALDLPVLPAVQDNMVINGLLVGNGRTWKPQRVLSVPGNGLWIIHVRAV